MYKRQIYTYQLINADTNQEVERSSVGEGVLTEHIFTDVDPALNYIVRVFPRNNSPIAITDPILSGNEDCLLESELIEGQALPEFTGSISVDKMPSCTPGLLTINITSPDVDFDLSNVNFSVLEIVGLNGVGPGVTVEFDDIANQPVGLNENANTDEDEDTSTLFFDLENIDTLTLQLSIAGNCVNTLAPLDVSETFVPFIPVTPEIQGDNPSRVQCVGDETGVASVVATTTDPADLVGRTFVYEISPDPNGVGRQTSGSFDNLPVGIFTINVIEIVSNNILNPTTTEECPVASEDIIIEEAIQLIAPTITVTQQSCSEPTDILASIQIDDATEAFGGAGDFTYQLLEVDTTAPVGQEPVVPVNINITNLTFENIGVGNFFIRVTDANSCTVDTLPVEVFPLPILEITEPEPVLDCAIETTGVAFTITASISNAADISSTETIAYRIAQAINTNGTDDLADDTVNTALITTTFDNTTGQFTLPEGIYTIEAITSETSCTIEQEVVIAPIVRVEATEVIPNAPTCFNGNDGSITTNVTNVVATTGYNYEVWTGNLTTVDIDTVAPAQTGTGTTEALSITDLGVGEHILRITDPATSCNVVREFTIAQAPEAAIATVTDLVFDCIDNEFDFQIATIGGGSGDGFQFQLTETVSGNVITALGTGTEFSIPASSTVIEYTLSIVDGDNCPGESVTIPSAIVPAFTVNNGNQNVCLPNATNTTGITATVNVTGAAPFRYRLSSIDGAATGTTTFTEATLDATGNSFNIEAADLPTTAGTFIYEVVDANSAACGLEYTIVINELIEISNASGVNPLCDAAGALPTTGSSFSFDIAGGNGTYEVAITGPATATDFPQTIPNVTSPFTFDNFGATPIEGTYTFTVTDGLNCVSVAPATFELENLEIIEGTATAGEILCKGGFTSVTITPTDLAGSPVSTDNLSFTVNGSSAGNINAAGTAFVAQVQAGSIPFQIINNVTGCIFEGQPITINDGAPGITIDEIITPQQCDTSGITAGEYSVLASGGPNGVAAFDYELILIDDLTGVASTTITQPAIQTAVPSGVSAIFDNLDVGNYQLIVSVSGVTDFESCQTGDFSVIIPPQPLINVLNTQFDDTDCVAGVSAFVVIDGGSAPENFELSFVNRDYTSPSDSDLDEFARFGDSDFTTLPTPIPGELAITIPVFNAGPPTTIATLGSSNPPEVVESITSQADVASRFFRITGLDPGTSFDIFVLDTQTGCIGTLEDLRTPDFEDITVTGLTLEDTSACGIDSGSTTVTFTTTLAPGDVFDIEVLNRNVDEMEPNFVLSSETFTVPAGSTAAVEHEVTIEGLAEVNRARVRVKDQNSQCSDSSEDFSIGSLPPVILNDEDQSVTIDCASPNGEASFTVQAINGRSPYTYILTDDTATINTPLPTVPVPTFNNTTGIFNIANDNINLFDNGIALPNYLGTVNVFVMDANGCTAGPRTVDVFEELPPVLTVDIASIDECNASDTSFTLPITIGNFDATQTYEVSITAATGTTTQELTVIPNATDNTIGESTVIVNGRGEFTITLTGDLQGASCESSQDIIIYEAPQVTLALSNPNCDGSIDTATATVTGGFEGVSTRILSYELFALNDTADIDPNEPIVGTLIPSNPPNTTGIFENGIAGVVLNVDTRYAVQITDTLDSGSSRSCTASNDAFQRAIILPSFLPPTLSLTCPLVNEASIAIASDFTGTPAPDATSADLFLFQFPIGTLESQITTSIAAGTVQTDGVNVETITTVTRTGNVFSGLDERFRYVQLLVADGCVLAELIDPFDTLNIIEPGDFTISLEEGTCNVTNGELEDSFIRITTTNAINTANVGAVYTAEVSVTVGTDVIDLGTSTLAAATDTPNSIDIPFDIPVINGVINIVISDSSISCDPITIDTPFTAIVPIVATATEAVPFSCNNDEEVTLEITNPVQSTRYTVSIIDVLDEDLNDITPSVSFSSVILEAPNFQIPLVLNTPGRYTFSAQGDDGSCPDQFVHTVEDVEQIIVNATGNSVTCEGDTASISFNVENYVGIYNYTLTSVTDPTISFTGTVDNTVDPTASVIVDGDGDPTVDITDPLIDLLSVDAYTLTIIATGGTVESANTLCTTTENVAIVGPIDEIAIITPINDEVIRCDQPTTIVVQAESGVPPYTYTITSPGGFNQSITSSTSVTFPTDFATPFIADTYTVNIEDNNACTIEEPIEFTLTNPIPATFDNTPNAQSITAANVCPDNASAFSIVAPATVGGTTSIATPVDSLRYELFSVTDNTGANQTLINASVTNNGTFDNVEPGIFPDPRFYFVRVTDAFGCFIESNIVEVVTTEPLSISSSRSTISCDVATTVFGNQEESVEFVITETGGSNDPAATFNYELFDEDGNLIQLPVGTTINPNSIILPGANVGSGGGVFTLVATDNNGCTNSILLTTPEKPAPVEFTINTSGELCFGETGFVNIPGGSSGVTGGVLMYEYELFIVDQNDITNEISSVLDQPLAAPFDTIERSVSDVTGFSGIPPLTLIEGAAIPGSTQTVDSATMTYAYKVSSGSCIPEYVAFEFDMLPELEYEIASNEISCAGNDDASFEITVTEGLGRGNFTVVIFRDDQTVAEGQSLTAIEPTSGPAEPVVFENLEPGNYNLLISDLGTNCAPLFVDSIEDPRLIIEDKTPLVLGDIDMTGGTCAGDTDAQITVEIIGGTPPYFFDLRETASLTGIVEPFDVLSLGLEAVEDPLQPGVFNLFIDATNQILFPIETDINYTLFVIDSGNSASIINRDPADNINVITDILEDDFASCSTERDGIIFETPDLDNFTVDATPDCNTLEYIISVDINNPELNEADLSIIVFELGATNPTMTGSQGLVPVSVPGGASYEVAIIDNVTGCETSVRRALNENPLVTFTSVEFVVVDDLGNAVTPFASTNEINVYFLQVVGGVNPTAPNAYAYFGTVTNLETGAISTIDIDSDGRFEVEETGIYQFQVFDNFGDFAGDSNDPTVSCKDISDPITLTHIDIDIPNVFNPSSGDPGENIWFPDNLTSDFIDDNGPLSIGNDNLNPDIFIPSLVDTGVGISSGTTVSTVTSPTTTTGGTVIGGVITSGTPPVEVTDGVSVGGFTTTTVTTGSTTVNGVTTAGTTVTTVVNDSTGEPTIIITSGGILTGGTLDNGVITGGTLSGGTIIADSSNPGEIQSTTTGGVTTFVITTGGTASGPTTTGATNTGGATTDASVADGGVIIGGTTTGGITTGGTTTGGITTVIEFGTTGTTVTTSLGTTINGDALGNESVIIGGTTRGGETTPTSGVTPILPSVTGTVQFIDFDNIEVLVFDRYGRLLAEFLGIGESVGDQGWDGTYEGNDMPSGDYWYLIKLNDDDGQEFTGHFTLYRR